MKTIILFLIGLAPIINSYSQNSSDALRYSTGEVQGTARFKAMSGAFGALGGDVSAISINPAGAAIFNMSHGALSVDILSVSNEANYGDGTNTISGTHFDLNQIGGVFVFKNYDNNSQWKKFVISLAYEQLQNYDNFFIAKGKTNNTIGNYFLNYANGLPLDEISALPGETISEAYDEIGYYNGYSHQQAYIGYESYILEPESQDDSNTVYSSNIAPGNFYQEYSHMANGYNGKLTANLAFQYNDAVYLGLNLNSHFINYSQTTHLFEENTNAGSSINQVDFENTLYTTGGGFSLQLGGIFKLNKNFRVGFTYDTPTWLTIREETTQYLSTINDAENIINVVNPNVINVFPEYKLQTPSKITASAAMIFGKKGLLSFDYSRKDYSTAKFKPENDSFFSSQNNQISNTLDVANTYRLGGEYRHQQMSFRAGYKLIESPFKTTNSIGDLRGFSLGFGYNFGNSRLDFAYENSRRNIDYQLYETGLTNVANIDASNSNVSLTLSMNL
jgi:hypothetical protein